MATAAETQGKGNSVDVTKRASQLTLPPGVQTLTPDVLLQHLPDGNVMGDMDSGVRVYNYKGELVATARSREWVLSAIYDDGEIAVGGTPNELHIEHLRGREVGTVLAAKVARDIRDALRTNREIPYGAMWYGTEREAWAQNPNTGAIVPNKPYVQIELQQGCFESPRQAYANPQALILDRAQAVLEAERDFPDVVMVDTSVPLTGSLRDKGVAINDGPVYGPYVKMTDLKLRGYMDHPTASAEELLERTTGKTFQQIQAELGHTGYWLNAASHVASSDPHINAGNELNVVPLEIAIADADMKVSNFSSLLEMIMASSPLFLGERAIVQGEDGQDHWLLDARTILRHLMDTAGPADDFVGTPKKYWERVDAAIADSLIATGDRAAYSTTYADGTVRPMMHGSVRIRMAAKAQGMDGGRIEYTGCGASPSLVDEAGRNALIEIMNAGMYEAVANQQSPAEYFAAKGFGSFGDLSQQQELVRRYSMYGAEDAAVYKMIQEGVRFIDYVANQYPNSQRIQQAAVLAKARVANLEVSRDETPRNLDDYRKTPHGAISVVMQHMIEDGMKPVEVMQRVAQYEHDIATDVIKVKGDVLQLLNGRR